MSKSGKSKSDRQAASPKPIDVVDGVPDRSARAPVWKYVLIALIGVSWWSFLIYCWFAG